MVPILTIMTERVLSLDCYGTLIDWEKGIVSALKPLLRRYHIHLQEEGILELYSRLERELEQGRYIPYRDVLRGVVEGFGKVLGFSPGEEEKEVLIHSLPGWKPFPDTVDSLRELKKRFKLAVISNIDDDLFSLTKRTLRMEFDWIVTAQKVGAYKPSPRCFIHALDLFGVPADMVVHAGQSMYHDIVPAKRLGMKTVWVRRTTTRRGFGATPETYTEPDHTVASLREVVELDP